MQTLDTILDKLDDSREQLLMAIEALPDEALTEEAAIGRFTIADILALQAVWEAELVTGFNQIDLGKQPDRLLKALADPKTYNKQRYLENKGRSLDSIFNDYQQVRVQVEQWLEAFSEKALNDSKRYKYFRGKSLVQIIGEVTWEREANYVSPLATFAQSWLERHDAETLTDSASFVPLTDLTTEDDSDDQPHN
jgi:hypothetical protein